MLSKIFVFLLREHQRHVSFDYHDLSFDFPSKLLAICSGGEGFLWGGGREKSHGFQGERSRDQSSPTGHKRGRREIFTTLQNFNLSFSFINSIILSSSNRSALNIFKNLSSKLAIVTKTIKPIKRNSHGIKIAARKSSWPAKYWL